MTEEQYRVLQKYEDKLNNALRNSFLRMSPSEFNEVAAVYDQLYTPLRQSQRNCNTCRLNALKTLGRAYNEEKTRRALEEAAKSENEKPLDLGVEKVIKNIIKKVGRPRKINTEE